MCAGENKQIAPRLALRSRSDFESRADRRAEDAQHTGAGEGFRDSLCRRNRPRHIASRAGQTLYREGLRCEFIPGVSPLASLSRRIAGQWFGSTWERVEALQAELAAMYRRPERVFFSFVVHLIGWIGTGIGGWIAFRLLGVPIGLLEALAIEGLLHAVLATAFLVPGYAGVQELAYAGIGALFGIPAEISIAVSLLRRSRDIAVGIPILCFWQLIEMRRLRLPAPLS